MIVIRVMLSATNTHHCAGRTAHKDIMRTVPELNVSKQYRCVHRKIRRTVQLTLAFSLAFIAISLVRIFGQAFDGGSFTWIPGVFLYALLICCAVLIRRRNRSVASEIKCVGCQFQLYPYFEIGGTRKPTQILYCPHCGVDLAAST